ncbi:MAG: hypothetical protein G01um101433_186 [Parcubacteria group bacterium Gr01-1014_33]|nr:MAG: hypothetical protein G01um101433_186 [Parcubacteria group bacterium Gr01-1014_33]
MNTITIPKKIAQKGDLVLIPLKEYEELRGLKRVREFAPSAAQKKALVRAEKNLKRRKTLSYNELVSKLGFTS